MNNPKSLTSRNASPLEMNWPFRAMSKMEREFDRWMRQNPLEWSRDYEGLDFLPSCNFKENKKEYIIEFDIPGIQKEDVKIEVDNHRLMVSGERKENKEEKDARHYLSETSYGSFMRSFDLPSAIDENKVDAHYEHGVLTVTVPKTEASNVKSIKVH